MRRFVRRLKFLFNIRKSIPFLKDFFTSKEVSNGKKLISVLLVVGYIFFPFDLIPDFFLWFGILDDVAVAGFVLQKIVQMAPKDLQDKYDIR
ncbi:DUF1232 domain-containing protein [Radiobacillus kanasensis]|uniref:YkvA family protein n=1 Tax=Radiobacillus kanasensis TaxID=2844358 RepID=UPI001E2AB4E6|nr:DUF1232 domain-containing protein [Radiobacillus kanasensis]UFT99786.1 DUF1232 domain-containing protein [Radiobacillus kanasensis]